MEDNSCFFNRSGSVGKRTLAWMLKMPPSQFIKDCSLQWLVQISVCSVPVIVNGCSSERPSCWISAILSLCKWQALLQALADKYSALDDLPLDYAVVRRVQVLLSEINLCSIILQRKILQGPWRAVFKSIPSAGTKSAVMLFSLFPWGLSSLSASGVKPVIWNLHPYYLLPSPSICTVSKSPGQRCHYTQSLTNQVQWRDLTEC